MQKFFLSPMLEGMAGDADTCPNAAAQDGIAVVDGEEMRSRNRELLPSIHRSFREVPSSWRSGGEGLPEARGKRQQGTTNKKET
jgi:hypothetical protein